MSVAFASARASAEPVSFVEALRIARPSVVGITCGRANESPRVGAGVVVDRAGGVLTVAHLVDRCAARVELAGGRAVGAKLVGRDTGLDLALLRLDAAADLPPPVAFSQALALGEPVAAIGRPAGLPVVASAGIVSGLDVEIASPVGPRGSRWRVVASDAATAPGSSGGPLVRTDGTVAGLVVMTHAEAKLTLAHPVATLLQAMARIAATSAPRRSRP